LGRLYLLIWPYSLNLPRFTGHQDKTIIKQLEVQIIWRKDNTPFSRKQTFCLEIYRYSFWWFPLFYWPHTLGEWPYTNEHDLVLFLSLYIPNPDNISWFSEALFSDNFLHRWPGSSSDSVWSKQYDIAFYIRYEPLYIISCIHYSKVRTEETGNSSHPRLYRRGFPARLNIVLLSFYTIFTIPTYL